jgi:ATP-binding cassette, subfamily B, heavy metal transporter
MQRYLTSPGGSAARGGENAAPRRTDLYGRWRVLRGLVPYVWPADRPDLQATVLVSLLLMLLAKIVTVTMPFAFKWATDALVAVAGGRASPR